MMPYDNTQDLLPLLTRLAWIKITEEVYMQWEKDNTLGACPRIERELRESWFESVFAVLLGE